MNNVARIGAAAPATYPQGIPPDVCLYFEKLALDLIRDGHKRYSADGILHQIRWHWTVVRGDRGFLVNNDWSAPLARWFLSRNPSAKGFFQLRIAKPKPVSWFDGEHEGTEDHAWYFWGGAGFFRAGGRLHYAGNDEKGRGN